MRFGHGTPTASHTSGIRGLSRFPLSVSSVTTVPPRARARPMTKGSAALRPPPRLINRG